MLAQQIETLARELIGTDPTSRRPGTLRFRSRGSLAVATAGAERGSWYDHEAGDGGDALALVAHLRRCSMGEAYAWALEWLGMTRGARIPQQRPLPAAKPLTAVRTPDTLDLARRLWSEAVAAPGTLVEAYLASRGLTLPWDAPLRFHPSCSRGGDRLPAMLALMTDPATAEPCGVHRTFLAPDGRGKAPGQAKMMAGHAGVIRLVPDEEVHDGLGLAEGIETALAVMQRIGWRPVWAATSAGGIARFPVLPGIAALTIFADADDGGAGMEAARKCGETWSAAAEVRILAAPPGEDFDDASRRAA